MAFNGIVTAEKLQDKLFQRQIMQEILKEGSGYASLNNPAIVKQASVRGTKVSITSRDSVTVVKDLKELEENSVKSPDYGNITCDLLADEIKVAFTDEALANATVADPMSMSIGDASAQFARALDEKIAAALDTTPQAGTAINVTQKSFYFAAAEAAGKMGRYHMSAIVTGPTAAGNIFAGLTSTDSKSAGWTVQNGITYLSGYNIPIIVSSEIEELAQGYAYFVSNEAPAAYVFTGQYKTRVYDDPDHRATIWQGDVWNGVLSNIRQTGGYNTGVVKTQITTS